MSIEVRAVPAGEFRFPAHDQAAAAANLTRPYGIRTIVSMNSIMIDGTGMCGGCRLIVGGETKFACVDGPDFDGHQVDFDSAMKRLNLYKAEEAQASEHVCRLTGGKR